MAAGQNDLNVLPGAPNLEDHGLHFLAPAVGFARDLFLYSENRFRLAQIDEVITAFHSENDTVHEIALPRRIFLLDRFPFRFTDLLKDDLLGGLRSDAAQFIHFNQRTNLVSNFSLAVVRAGFFQRNFCFGVAHGFDDDLFRDDGNFPGFRVDLDLDILGLSKPLFGGSLQGGFYGADDFGLVDAFLPADFVDDGNQFSVHNWLSTPTPMFTK